MKSKEYSAAINTMNDLEKMNLKLPTSMFYFKGKAYHGINDYSNSYKYLEIYLSKVDRNGKYYSKSIELIGEVEEKQKAKQKLNDKNEKKELLEKAEELQDSVIDTFDRLEFTKRYDGERKVKYESDVSASSNGLCKIRFYSKQSIRSGWSENLRKEYSGSATLSMESAWVGSGNVDCAWDSEYNGITDNNKEVSFCYLNKDEDRLDKLKKLVRSLRTVCGELKKKGLLK